MNRLQLYRLLRSNSRLGRKRNPALEQSKVARVLKYVGGTLGAAYMLFIGVAMGAMALQSAQAGLLLVLMPLILLLDLALRFVAQQTPIMQVKPYLLLPLPQHTVIENFLVSSVLSTYNLLWLFMFGPYAYMVAVGGLGVQEALVVLVTCLLLVAVDSQWYLLVRTLVGRSLLWWALPVAVYASYVPLLIYGADSHIDLALYLLDTAVETWWLPLGCLVLLGALLWLNRWMQFRFVYEEVARQERRPRALRHVSRLGFLERFGQTGEYLKLELKSIMRNKAIRSRVTSSLGLIVALSALIAYTDVYDGRMMLNFWCYYCFAIYGMTTLVKVMGPEGNYIDLLMTQREHILLLLRAKYYFHVAILLVPLLVMTPAIIAGKFSLLMVVAYLLMSSGPLYLTLFQLAVTNKQTLPLDQKLTGKGNVENGFQLLVELAAMLGPLLLVGLLVWLFDDDTAYWVLAALGLLITAAHPLWLRNIYRRMMRRKYANMEGFHATR